MSRGQLKIVGIGPAGAEWMCGPALDAVRQAQVVCGYKTYIDLIRPILKDGQEIVQTGMTKEKDRCLMAIEQAMKGQRVVLVCSGDPGIYGLSGLVFELLKGMGDAGGEIEVEVIPGISALNACASLLGAPLIHDFAVISLSDLLTPWELIEKRLDGAARADFVIVLYNPRSKRRRMHLPRALEIISRYRSGSTPVGIVTKAMRQGQRVEIVPLSNLVTGDLEDYGIGMQSLLIVGNSTSYEWDDKMITPRGYDI